MKSGPPNIGFTLVAFIVDMLAHTAKLHAIMIFHPATSAAGQPHCS
jgi:hypothetical protein